VTSDAWAAGFFEGEGTIGLTSAGGGRSHRLSVEVSQIDREPLDALMAAYGGRIYRFEGGDRQRAYFRWALATRQAVAFLERIEPHVIRASVRERIAVAREFQACRRFDHSNRTEAYKARDDALVGRMRELNRRGPDLTPLEQMVLGARR
jgi:hypothetical protein